MDNQNKTKILGAGLVCIDVVHSNEGTRIMNGGSCANVLSVLSQIGFDCTVLRTCYSDLFEDILSSTLSSLGVKQVIFRRSDSETPRIIEQLTLKNHKFFTSCPVCGERILKINLPTEKNLVHPDVELNEIDLFYCDRTSDGIRAIMQSVQQNHGITFYEPNSARNISALLETAQYVDIIKFSQDRVPKSISERLKNENKSIKLAIVTEGKKGLSYTYRMQNGRMSDWVEVRSKFKGPIIDSSGAGDWLTAGFISELLRNRQSNDFNTVLNTTDLTSMLSQGMKYSQLCCAAIGAQGVFYSPKHIDELRELLISDSSIGEIKLRDEEINPENLCPTCYSAVKHKLKNIEKRKQKEAIS